VSLLQAPSDPTFQAILAQTRVVADELEIGGEMRGPLEWFVGTFSVLNYGLTPWPAIAPERRVPAGVLKNLFGLWALVADDTLDKRDSHRDVIDCVMALADRDDAPAAPPGRVMRELLARAAALGDAMPLRVALGEYVTGQVYEHACRRHPWLAETERFEHHRSITMGHGPLLAIDVLAASDALTDSQRRALIVVYRELWTAWRYAYDLSSLERDRNEGALGVVDVWDGDDRQRRRRALRRMRMHLGRARRAAGELDVPGLDGVVAFGARLTAAWLSSDLIGDEAHLQAR
jgi:hypothetical protein